MSEEFDGRFNERLLELTQDAFSRLGFQLFDPTGEPADCVQNLVKESLETSSKASKKPKPPEPQPPIASEVCSESKEHLISCLNLHLEEAGDMQYRISNLLAIIESHEEKILSIRPELMQTITDQDTPLGQRATEIKQKVLENAKAEKFSMQQEDQRWIKKQSTNPARNNNPGSKANESLLQRKEREFQLLSTFFKYIASDLANRRNINRLELAADLRGIRQALKLLLDQNSPEQRATTILERQSSENQQQSSSACSSKAEQKYSVTMPVTKHVSGPAKAQGSKVNVSIEAVSSTGEKGPSTSSSSSLLSTHKQCVQGGSKSKKTDITFERHESTEIIEIIDDDDDD
ncbi:hypothetical protein AND_005501 [Anopheles darlingi]|uniref:Uncharacterized protein n=1 Tax=Anopheles darlingi TaxID=43151 RepID=W5JEN0_ANODA|nr:hypothetical protein AND_005501 [Anopheles darlingi]